MRNKLEDIGIMQKDSNEFKRRSDYWSVRGWNTTLKKLDYRCDVLFFGHSQIEMSDFRQYFPGINIITSGYPGDNVEGMRMRVEQIKALKPLKMFLACGVNSLKMSDEEFESKYDKLITEIRKASPNTELYIFNILPECDGKLGKAKQNHEIRERNNFIRQYTESHKLAMIDLYNIYVNNDGNLKSEMTIDGIHLNPHGYDAWAEAIRPYMKIVHDIVTK